MVSTSEPTRGQSLLIHDLCQDCVYVCLAGLHHLLLLLCELPLGAFPFQYRAAGRGSRGACLRTVAEDIGSGKFWKRKCPSDVPVC